MVLAAILAVVLAAAAPALAGSRSGNDSAKGNPGKGNSGHNKDFAGLVDVGGGRKMYMECQGKGSPTVVFVAGAGDRAETWSKTLDRSKQAVLPAIAKTNRVCAYDRPGTFVVTGEGEEDFATSRSDPVAQPTTLQDGAADLHALLRASGERGPYVVVAHSMGGSIAKLYASEHPREVSGPVLIDYTPYDARNSLTRKQWGYWKILLGPSSKEALDLYPDIEWFDHQRNLEEVTIGVRSTWRHDGRDPEFEPFTPRVYTPSSCTAGREDSGRSKPHRIAQPPFSPACRRTLL